MSATLPKLRFSSCHDPWATAQLKESFSFISYGFTNPMPEADNGPYMITAKEIASGKIRFENARRTTQTAFEELLTEKSRPKAGDILLTKDGSLGRLAVVGDELLCINQSVAILRPITTAVPQFFYQLLSTPKYQGIMLRNAGGSTIKHIYITVVDKMKIVTPPLPEQRKIADFLTAVDGRIAQLVRKKALLEDYKKGVMQQLFTQALRFKDDHGNDFPEWEEKKLGDVCDLVGGLTYTPGDVVSEGLLVLRSSNVQNGQLVFGDNVFVAVEVNDWNMTRPDDILICVRNGSKNLIGKNAIIPEGCPPSTHGAFMTVLRGEQNRFVFQLLQTDIYKRNVHINLGATINSINGSDLKKFKFSFPSLPEQTKIADLLTALDRKIATVSTQITETQTWKKGLLQQMFV